MAKSRQWQKIKLDLEQRFQHKTLVILGFGREGISTYQLFKKLSIPYTLYVMDQNPETVQTFLDEHQDDETRVLSKEDYLKDLDTYDVIFKTPGLPGFLLHHIEKKKILSQAELFMEYMGDCCIGITGTKGKSTTSSLVAWVLTQLGIATTLVGNIGYPALECLEQHEEGKWYVYEMSSFQTEFLHHGPRIRIILNLFEEHLNNYDDYRAYQNAKLQLFKSANAEQRSLCLYGADNTLLCQRVEEFSFQPGQEIEAFGKIENNRLHHPGVFLDQEFICSVNVCEDKQVYGSQDFPRHLLGEHNLINSLVVINIVDYLGREGVLKESAVRPETLLKYIGEFKGLEHRLEKVGTYYDVTFFNDSISTIPEATLQAMQSIPHLKTLLIGGFDRGINYIDFTKKLLENKTLQIICLPDTGHKIYQWAKEIDAEHVHLFWHKVQGMEEAVDVAYKVTPVKGSCLLSPAASSYNCYKNFEERGQHYKQEILRRQL